MAQITVLGAGAWGTAVATLLAKNNHEVLLWCHELEVAKDINENQTNLRYLPGISLSPHIAATNDLAYAVKSNKIIFEATPVPFLRFVLEKAKQHVSPDVTWVMLSKGIEQETLLLPSQIIQNIFGLDTHIAVISGPNFAKDLALEMPTGTTVASTNHERSLFVAHLLANSYVKPYINSDVIGAQVAGALKNVITLAIGLVRGAGYTDNTVSFILTRGLKETSVICHTLGGKDHSTYGLAGVGDLVLTSMGSLSRNLKMGMLLAQGSSLEQIKTTLGVLPEGANTVQSVEQLRLKKGLSLPICQGVHDVVYKKATIKEFLNRIMTPQIEEE